MKKFSIVVLLIVTLTIFTSCDWLFGEHEPEQNTYPTNNNPPVFKTQKFWAMDMSNNGTGFYQLDAECLAYNAYCEVWVEKKSGMFAVTKAQAESIANEYANKIYGKLIDYFGWTGIINGVLMNTIQCADFLGDKNGRLIILLLDIQDGFDGTGGYVAGYFDQNMFLEDNVHPFPNGTKLRSNQCDMIFMDTYPSLDPAAWDVPNRPSMDYLMKEFYATMAHETQHLMNFVSSFVIRGGGSEVKSMDLWINEGLSSAAEYVYSGQVSQERIAHYNSENTGIENGDNFYVWDDGNLNEYATVSIFFQWLRVHWGQYIYQHISLSEKTDYNAITDLDLFNGNSYNWPSLFTYWHAANYVQHSSYVVGYKNEFPLNAIKANFVKGNSNTISLLPGEAVYSYSASGRSLPADHSTIWYYGLSNTGLDDVKVPANGALLTFNRNTNINGNPVSATVTGAQPPNANINLNLNYLNTENKPRIYRIDSGSILRSLSEFDASLSKPVVYTEDIAPVFLNDITVKTQALSPVNEVINIRLNKGLND